MIGNTTTHPALFRILAGYAVACFVVLQLLDIVLEPLGMSVAVVRWVMLVMIGIAPLLVIIVSWISHRRIASVQHTDVIPDHGAVFQIGQAELDTGQRQIRFAGNAVDVQPKVFDLIEYLVRAKERVVGKDELFDNIWPDVVVTEASLTQSVKRARNLFRENGFVDDVIRTVPRKGYQFDYTAEPVGPVSQRSANAWLNIVLPTAVVALLATAIGSLVWNSGAEPTYRPIASEAANSLVVLPFANMTPDEGFGYFSDGLTETLTTSLTMVRDLRVIARGSAFSFRDARPDYGEIGQQLNVGHIVEGSVQRNDDELRISARLIRANDGEQLWSEIYSRTFDNAFALQDDISRSIVEQMSTVLSARLELPAAQDSDTPRDINGEAFRLVLLGNSLGSTASADGMRDAEENFRAALRIEPDYPEAMLALANSIVFRAVTGELPREPTFAEALSLIRAALEINPNFASAYVQLGEIQHRHFWDFNDAAESYTLALQLNSGSADAQAAYGRFLSKIGKFDQAIEAAEIALDLDPKSARAASSLAIRQIKARQLANGRQVIDALTAARPEHADLPWLETNWHIRNGSYRDALQWIALEELDYLRLSLSAITLEHLGRTQQAQEALDELIETDGDGAAFQIAEVYAQWGQSDAAFEWLERAFSHGDPGLAELYSSVNLESLYDDSRFAELANRVGLPPIS